MGFNSGFKGLIIYLRTPLNATLKRRQERQYTYNVTMRPVLAAIVAVEKR